MRENTKVEIKPGNLLYPGNYLDMGRFILKTLISARWRTFGTSLAVSHSKVPGRRARPLRSAPKKAKKSLRNQSWLAARALDIEILTDPFLHKGKWPRTKVPSSSAISHKSRHQRAPPALSTRFL